MYIVTIRFASDTSPEDREATFPAANPEAIMRRTAARGLLLRRPDGTLIGVPASKITSMEAAPLQPGTGAMKRPHADVIGALDVEAAPAVVEATEPPGMAVAEAATAAPRGLLSRLFS